MVLVLLVKDTISDMEGGRELQDNVRKVSKCIFD